MSSIYDWSLTAASNGNSDSAINWQEGQLPSTVNNSARQMMARHAEFLKDIGATVTAGGTANALTLTANSPFTAYATGQIVAFKASATNTGAATLNVNGIGAKAIRKNTTAFDAALVGGEILDDGVYVCIYDATLNSAAGGWMLFNPATIQESSQRWRSRFIGEIIYANTAVTGAESPPSSVTDTVWIELTSGLTGVGQFNNAKLTSESISGSAPLVLATAVINYAGSAMNGQTIRLINTESRILRPSISPGTIQDDAFQGHRHSLSSSVFTGGAGSLGTSSGNTNPLSIGDPTTDGTNGTPRTANETRMKNIGVKAYMRIA